MIGPWEWIAVAAAPFIGSFLGVLADRLPQGRSIVWPRSHCQACGTPLRPAELIPIVSWLALRGRCAHCAAPIPLHLPLIELTALGAALLVALLFDGDRFLAGLFLGACLIPLALADWRLFVLPDPLILTLAAGGIGWNLWSGDVPALDMLIGGAVGGGSFLILAAFYRQVRGREGLGRGDAKLMAAAGLWLGWQGLPVVGLVGSLTALVALMPIALAGRQPLTATTRLPFGTFLCIGIALVWLRQSLLP